MKVLLENLLRYEDGRTVTRDDVQSLVDWLKERRSDREIGVSILRGSDGGPKAGWKAADEKDEGEESRVGTRCGHRYLQLAGRA